MPRKPVIENPDYTILLNAIIPNPCRQANIRKKISKPFTSSPSNVSMKLQQLRKLGFIQTQGKNKYTKNYIHYEGILKYILKNILLCYDLKVVKELASDQQLQLLLSEYLKIVYKTETNINSINYLLKNFVFGYAKGFLENRKNKQELAKFKSEKNIMMFINLCLVYWLNEIETPALVSSYSVFKGHFKIK